MGQCFPVLLSHMGKLTEILGFIPRAQFQLLHQPRPTGAASVSDRSQIWVRVFFGGVARGGELVFHSLKKSVRVPQMQDSVPSMSRQQRLKSLQRLSLESLKLLEERKDALK